MKISKKISHFLLALLTFSFLIIGCGGSGDGDDDSPPPDISGTWHGETERGIKFSMTLQQNGTMVSGTYKDDVFESPLQEGELNNDTFTAVMIDPSNNDIFDINSSVAGDNMDGTVTHRATGAMTDITATRN